MGDIANWLGWPFCGSILGNFHFSFVHYHVNYLFPPVRRSCQTIFVPDKMPAGQNKQRLKKKSTLNEHTGLSRFPHYESRALIQTKTEWGEGNKFFKWGGGKNSVLFAGVGQMSWGFTRWKLRGRKMKIAPRSHRKFPGKSTYTTKKFHKESKGTERILNVFSKYKKNREKQLRLTHGRSKCLTKSRAVLWEANVWCLLQLVESWKVFFRGTKWRI